MKFKRNATLLFWSIFMIGLVGCQDIDIEENQDIETNENQGLKSASLDISGSQKINVYWDQNKQEIDGFGISQAFWANFLFRHQKRDELMGLFFGDQGLGLSILRGEVFPHFSSAQGQTNFNTDANIFVPLNSDYFNADPWGNTEYLQRAQQWVTHVAKQQYLVDKLMFTTWSPPAWMKTNNSQTDGGKVKTEFLDDYAAYLAQFVNAYEAKGYPIYALSPANEPEYAASWNSCLWSSSEMAGFVKNQLKSEWLSQGLTTKVIVGEPGWWGVAETFVNGVLSDPAARDFVDIAAGHGYFGVISPYERAVEYGKRVWQTEISKTDNLVTDMEDGLFWAKRYHDYLTDANVNAFIYWLGARPATNNESLIVLNGDTDYTIAKRYDTFGNFTRYIKPGYVRLNSTVNPTSNVYTSAYKNPETGEFTMVAINNTAEEKSFAMILNGAQCAKLKRYVTTASNRWQEESDVYNTDNSSFRFVLPPKSVVTFTGQVITEIITPFNDALDNFSKSVQSQNLVIDTSKPYYFNSDAGRAKRVSESDGYVVYQVPDLKGFSAIVYHHTGVWEGVSFQFSSDGNSWTTLPHESFDSVYSTLGWYRKNYFNKVTPPVGTQYLKVLFSGVGAWEKQLADISIAVGP